MDGLERLILDIEGAVQGVGFRPFVYRLARTCGVGGSVANDARGVVIDVQGTPAGVARFVERLRSEAPPAARIETIHSTPAPPRPVDSFEIVESRVTVRPTAQMLPDLATCEACVAEIFDPNDRRYRYPFTNCTGCGPRLSIIEALPYDRPHTTMARFEMCGLCRAEYENPADRRFHAQPIACPDCGPQLTLLDAAGKAVASGDAALAGAARALESGASLAVKGLGGFHLMVDARDGAAIARLRAGKPRREKPLALMARDLAQAKELCVVDAEAAALLRSVAAPIVLLPRRQDGPAHEQVAPGSSTLGVMLPYTPLHHLLLRRLNFPLVATSGNLADEPICIDEAEATRRLRGIADRFLVHDRPIARQVDDSVVRARTVLRRARGYAPRPVRVSRSLPSVLAVGGQLKNAIAVSVGRRVYVSQHIGDMETPESHEAFEQIVRDYLSVYRMRPEAIAHDLHPGYATTRWAQSPGAELDGLTRIGVQHHHAHLAACLVDNRHDGAALGIIWDGTGYGKDGTVWGGEFLLGDATGFVRAARLKRFSLPGAEAAIREPRRTAAALLWEIDGAAALENTTLECFHGFSAADRALLVTMMARGTNSPRTSSIGRLFDGVAALLGLHPCATFEGQAAMALEQIADTTEQSAYTFHLETAADADIVLDWRPLLLELLADVAGGVAAATIAARFHNALVATAVRVAERVGIEAVALSGGCFQNRLLAERIEERLTASGFTVLAHRAVPPNDGGLALGQIAIASARMTDRG